MLASADTVLYSDIYRSERDRRQEKKDKRLRETEERRRREKEMNSSLPCEPSSPSRHASAQGELICFIIILCFCNSPAFSTVVTKLKRNNLRLCSFFELEMPLRRRRQSFRFILVTTVVPMSYQPMYKISNFDN